MRIKLNLTLLSIEFVGEGQTVIYHVLKSGARYRLVHQSWAMLRLGLTHGRMLFATNRY